MASAFKKATAAGSVVYGDWCNADATSAAFTIILPPVLSGYDEIVVKKVDASANAVTVAPASGTIDGAASYQLVAQWSTVVLNSDGTNWYVRSKI